jgi:hypothetical protein
MLVNSDQSTHPLDNAAMLRESEGVCVENGIGRNFHFAFQATIVYRQLPLLQSFSDGFERDLYVDGRQRAHSVSFYLS